MKKTGLHRLDTPDHLNPIKVRLMSGLVRPDWLGGPFWCGLYYRLYLDVYRPSIEHEMHQREATKHPRYATLSLLWRPGSTTTYDASQRRTRGNTRFTLRSTPYASSTATHSSSSGRLGRYGKSTEENE